jgi:hypothetical protein
MRPTRSVAPAWVRVPSFHDLLGGDNLLSLLAEVTDALESGSDPGGLSGWIDGRRPGAGRPVDTR